MDNKVLIAIIAVVAVVAAACGAVVLLNHGDNGGKNTDSSILNVDSPGTIEGGTYQSVIIGPSVGDGTVIMKSVKILGDLIIRGGGSHSVELDSCEVGGTTTVEKEGGEAPRIYANNTQMSSVNAKTDTIIESSGTGGFDNVTTSGGADVTVQGSDTKVETIAVSQDSTANVTAGSVSNLNMSDGSNVNVSGGEVSAVNVAQDSTVGVQIGNSGNVQTVVVADNVKMNTTGESTKDKLDTADITMADGATSNSVSIDGTETHIHSYILDTEKIDWSKFDKAKMVIEAPFVCEIDAGHTTTKTLTVTSVRVEPACTVEGTITYSFTYENKVYENPTKDTIPVTGHEYEAQFEWTPNNDGTYSVICTIVCKNEMNADGSYKVMETVDATVTPNTKPATSCTEDVTTTYTAKATFDGKEFSATKDVEMKSIGHDYFVEYVWSEDGKECTVKFTCANNAEHNISFAGEVISSVKTPATCDKKGVTTYTVSGVYDGFQYGSSKDVEDIEALGHNWEVTFTWSNDHQSATYSAACSRDQTHTESGNAVVVYTETVPRTCTTDGRAEYSAYAVLSDGTRHDCAEKFEDVFPAGHDYEIVSVDWDNLDMKTGEVPVNVKCKDCNEETTLNLMPEVTDSKDPTCTEAGFYTMKIDYNGSVETHTYNFDALGHNYFGYFKWSADYKSATCEVMCLNERGEDGTPKIIGEFPANVAEEVLIAPTCEVNGKSRFTATYTYEGKPFTDNVEMPVPLLMHDYTYNFVWAEDYSTATVVGVCKHDPTHTVEGRARVTVEGSPDCESGGKVVYTATYTIYGQQEPLTDVKEVEYPAGHIWDVRFEFSDDYSEATYYAVCERDQTHTATGKVTTVRTVNDEATCSEPGLATYKATVELNGKTFSDSVQAQTAPLGHKWNVTFSWAQDYSTAEYNAVCANDNTHTASGDARVTVSTVSNGCDQPGKIVYTAFAYIGQEVFSDTKTVEVQKTGHDYRLVFAFSKDGKQASYEATCSRCGDIQRGMAKVTTERTQEPTCTAAGTEMSIATVTIDGRQYFSEPTFTEIPALGHVWTETTYVWSEDHKGCTAHKECTRCGEVVDETATVTSRVHTAATCENVGVFRYTATFPTLGTATYDETFPALGHHYVDMPAKEATCEEPGWNAYHYCEVCGKNDKVVIPALGHDYVHHDAKDPTETEDGWYAYDECTRCGDNNKVIIPALGKLNVYIYGGKIGPVGGTIDQVHMTVAYDTVLTAVFDGAADTIGYWSDQYGQRMFGSTFDILVRQDLYITAHPIQDYTYGDWIVAKEPSCDTDGLKYCETADKTMRLYQIITGYKHLTGDLVTVHEPTCTEGGDGYYECSLCHERFEVTLYAHGHNIDYSTGVPKDIASGSHIGSMEYSCRDCDEKVVKPYISATIPSGDIRVVYRGDSTYSTRESVCADEIHTTWKIDVDGVQKQAYLYYIAKDQYSGTYNNSDVQCWFLWIDDGEHSPVYVARNNNGHLYPRYTKDNTPSGQYGEWGICGYLNTYNEFVEFIDKLNVGQDNGRHASSLYDLYYRWQNAYNYYGPDHFTLSGDGSYNGVHVRQFTDATNLYLVDDNNCCLVHNEYYSYDGRLHYTYTVKSIDTVFAHPFTDGYSDPEGNYFAPSQLPTLATTNYFMVTVLGASSFGNEDSSTAGETGRLDYFNVNHKTFQFNSIVPSISAHHVFDHLEVRDNDGVWHTVRHAQFSGGKYGFDLNNDTYGDTILQLYEYLSLHPEMGNYTMPTNPAFDGIYVRCVCVQIPADSSLKVVNATFGHGGVEDATEADLYGGDTKYIHANTDFGKKFIGWTITVNGKNVENTSTDTYLSYVIPENSEVVITANFQTMPDCNIVFNVTEGGTIVGAESGRFPYGMNIEAYVEYEMGYQVIGWYVDYEGLTVRDSEEYGKNIQYGPYFWATAEMDCTYTAVLEKDPDFTFYKVSAVNGFVSTDSSLPYYTAILVGPYSYITPIENPHGPKLYEWTVETYLEGAVDSTSNLPIGAGTQIYYDTVFTGVTVDSVTFYTVTYMDGEEKLGEYKVGANATHTLMNKPTKEGFVFENWNSKADGTGTEYGNTVEVTGDMIIYAYWTVAKKTIYFDKGNMYQFSWKDMKNYVDVEYGSTYTIPADQLTVYGADVVGWKYTNAEGVEVTVAADGTGVVPYGTDRVYAVYGNYKPYILHFLPNCEDYYGVMEDYVFTTETLQSSTVGWGSANNYTRPGYTLQNWSYLDPVKTTSRSYEVNVSDILKAYPDGGTIDLTANWKQITYTIVLKNVSPSGVQASGNIKSLEFHYGEKVTFKAEPATASSTITCPDHVLIGWALESNKTAVVYQLDEVLDAELVIFELSQKWSSNATGYQVTMYTVWVSNTYTIHFYSEAGNNSPTSQTMTRGTPTALNPNGFVKDGKTFVGWSTDPQSRTAQFTDGQVIEKDLTDGTDVSLFAVWADTTYTIEFYIAHETGEPVIQEVEYNVPTQLKANTFVVEGKTFAYWIMYDEYYSMHFFEDKEEVVNLTTSGSVSLYAVWAEPTYTIVFLNNVDNQTYEQVVNYGERVTLTAYADMGEFCPEGKVFDHWETAAWSNDGARIFNDGMAVSNLTVEGTIYLYAVYEESP